MRTVRGEVFNKSNVEFLKCEHFQRIPLEPKSKYSVQLARSFSFRKMLFPVFAIEKLLDIESGTLGQKVTPEDN